MNNQLCYILWYHKHFGKTLKGRRALSFYGSYEALYEAVYDGTEKTGLLKNVPFGKYDSFSAADAMSVISVCERNGWEIIACTSEYYPSELLEINDYPHILFADGDKTILTRNIKFAIVGSRAAMDEAEVIAHNAAYNLAATGAVIVSGAAVGIDSAAHYGAVRSGGCTIGVLGCGLGNSYMQKISDFYDEIKASGVYITELFPFEGATRSSFPDRNRLISGLSRGVLVACAASGSGSLNTAAHAKKQNRSVFVTAPEICYSEGCAQLLNEGAYTFYNAGDMAYPFMKLYKDGSFDPVYCNKPITVRSAGVKREDMSLPKREKADRKNHPSEKTAPKAEMKPSDCVAEKSRKEASDTVLPDFLGEDAVKIYGLLGETALVTEDIVRMTGLGAVSVQIAVSELEMSGLVKCLAGGRVSRI